MADLVKCIYPTGEDVTAGIEIDAFISEQFHFGNSITELPVEEGSTVSDHVTPEPDTLSIEAFIGATKFEVLMSDIPKEMPAIEDANAKQRIIEAYTELKRIKETMQPMDIVTGLDVMTNMVIKTFDIDRDVETGVDLPFTMTFKKVGIVKSETTQISARAVKSGTSATDQAGATTDVGATTVEQPPENFVERTAYNDCKAGLISSERFQRMWNETPEQFAAKYGG
jgi:hypothetical protein